jgi:hypothetical protein
MDHLVMRVNEGYNLPDKVDLLGDAARFIQELQELSQFKENDG